VTEPAATLDLWDYRRRVEKIYARVRASEPEAAHEAWIGDRDHLFRVHPQSPLSGADRAAFTGLKYFPYDPELRFTLVVEPVEPEEVSVSHSGERQTSFRRFGRVRLDLSGGQETLTMFWLEGYGGGVFVPFKDSTAGTETYGGGRYLLDSAKGADLGSEEGRVVLDFNFAYHPSCVHSVTWSCPLAPIENQIEVAVRAGERLRSK
jgi:uncharacterized protein (DUF1684 family)